MCSDTIRVVALLVVVSLAGCAGVDQQASPAATTAGTVTPGPTTDAPVGTSGYETDLDVRSYEDEPVELTVTVTRNATGETVFERTLTLGHNEVREFDVPFPEPGAYTVRTERGGKDYTYGWAVERVDPSYELVVEASDGGVSYVKSAA